MREERIWTARQSGFESHNGKLKTSSLRVYHIVKFYNFLGDETNSQNEVDSELSFRCI